MTFPDKKKIESLKQAISKNPDGSTISALSSKTKMNRNLVAKYLDYLAHVGQLEMRIFGSSKVYSLSSRVPVAELVHHAFDPVIMFDKDLRILSVNNEILSLLHETAENLIGKKIVAIHNPVLTSLIQNSLPEKNPKKTCNAEVFTPTIQGTSHYFNVKTIPVVYEDGMPGTVVILHDISAEKKYQKIQDLNKIREDAINEDQTEFVIRFLPDGSLTFMNPAMCRFFKRKPGERTGLAIRSAILLEDHPAFDHVLSMLKKEQPFSTFRCRIIDPSGRIRHTDWTIRALFDNHGTIQEYQGVGTDSSEKYAAMEMVNQYVDDQALLYRMSCEFSAIPNNADIFEMIGRGVQDILPTAVVGVNTLDTSTMAIKSRCFVGNRDREIFFHYLGKDIVGHVIEAPETVERNHSILKVMGGKLFKVPGNLYVMMLGQIPADTCERIEHHLNIGDMYIMGLVSGNLLFGNVAIFLRKGETLKRNEIIEIFIRHATLALKCRYLDEGKVLPNPVTEIYPPKPEESGSPGTFLHNL